MVEFTYRCAACGRSYGRDEVRYLVDRGKAYRPGIPLCGVLSAEFDCDAIRRRFRKSDPDWGLFCAVEAAHFPQYPAGRTPFFRSGALGRTAGLPDTWIKNDGLNPSGSLKDRASLLVAAEARRLGRGRSWPPRPGTPRAPWRRCAPRGACAPSSSSPGARRARLAQMLIHGACVVPVDGTYDDAFRLSLEYTARHGGLNRNTAYHPLTIEGKKTVGLEIWMQNGWRAPSVVIVPTGDGVILAGVAKAFDDLLAARLIRELPRLVCVQAEHSDAIHRYIVTGQVPRRAQPRDDRGLDLGLGALERAHGACGRDKERRGLAHSQR